MTNIASATYDIAIKEGKPVITRNLVFRNGDTISFTITLEANAHRTLIDLHRESAQAAIEYLEDWLKSE